MNAADRGDKLWLSAVREVDHLFERLGRYTRFVAYSKWTLLAISLFLVVFLIAWPLVTKDKSGLRISFIARKIAGQDPSSPVMTNPEYRGTGSKGQQFRINGARATQMTTTRVAIEQVEAQTVKANGQWYSLTADRADYDQQKKTIELAGNVTLVDEQSTNFVTPRATITLEPFHIYGNEQVSGAGSFGNILASGFEIADNGNRILFKGGAEKVHLTVDRAKKKR